MKRNGFTLIELMIVIAIIMILGNVIYSAFFNRTQADQSTYQGSQSQYSDRKETR